jgi:signal transduction histidine kinase
MDQGQKTTYQGEGAFLASTADMESLEDVTGDTGTALLMQAADAALARTDFLRDVSAALMRVLYIDEAHPQAYEQLKRELAEPWFIIDRTGACVCLNRAAETFCGMHIEQESGHGWSSWPEEGQALFSSFRPLASRQESPFTLEQALAPLLPRMRHLKGVLAYLREFSALSTAQEESAGEGMVALPAFLRCVLAAEPLSGQVSLSGAARGESASIWSPAELREPQVAIAPSVQPRVASSPTLLLDSSPSDHHYQFARHALYAEDGQWFANALHVHDVTEQVRDEKNKTVLLASVSHDLRTPLTTIKAAVTGLLQPGVTWDEEMRREILEDIDAETDHLHTLVNALVEMSRIEMGALVLDKEWCDMVELVHNTLNRASRLLSDFTISTQVQSPVPLIYADYAQLERVLYNLLENAARHSPRGSQMRVIVDSPARRELPVSVPEGVARAIRVRIEDEGPGIPEEERERVFKSFYSLDAQGNGLGLAICRGIVEAHTGRIWVEPGKRGGACFVFILPVTA